MIHKLLSDIATLVRAPQLYHRLFVRDAVSILMYHAVARPSLAVPDWCFVDEAVFLSQMRYLRQHCHVVRLRDLTEPLSPPSGRPVVVLTFDDGFANNFDVAFPILRALDLPATVFVVTDLVGTQDTVWFCRINAALAGTTLRRLDWEGERFDLNDTGLRARASARLQAGLKAYPHAQLHERTRALVRALGDNPDRPIEAGSPYRMLDPDQIRRMRDSGLIDFGAHTTSHAILSRLPSSERRRQIEGSLQAVDRLVGRPCQLFAYPNGRRSDYGPPDTQVLAEHGVQLAVTTTSGPATPAAEAGLELCRYGIGHDTSVAQLQMLVHHLAPAHG